MLNNDMYLKHRSQKLYISAVAFCYNIFVFATRLFYYYYYYYYCEVKLINSASLALCRLKDLTLH